MNLYGLLYISERHQRHTNTRKRGHSAIRLYLDLASRLSSEAKAHGIPFYLITNRADELQTIQQSAQYTQDVDIVQIPFTRSVPEEAAFYQAHYKLDVLKEFGKGSLGTVTALVDLDMTMLRPMPHHMVELFTAGCPAVVDITDQVIPAYGYDCIANDLDELLAQHVIGLYRWFGGEFIAGSPEFFRLLSQRVDEIYDRYCAIFRTLHHNGDEIIVSAALNLLHNEGLVLYDLAAQGLIGRYWSTPPRHRQRPLSWYEDSVFLHLPSDKGFLASRRRTADPETFLRFYRRHAARKIAVHHVAAKVRSLRDMGNRGS